MTIIQPGLYALLAMETEDAPAQWPVNFADRSNRNARSVYSTEVPEGGLLLATGTGHGTAHSVKTPFGPLTSSDTYILVPASSTETHFLPNVQYAYNWLVLDFATPTPVSIDGATITIGDVSFSVHDGDSMDDCAGYRPEAPKYTLADIGLSVVDDDFVEVASFKPSDPEFGCFTHLFGEVRLDFDMQHVTIDEAQCAKLETLGTPAARALLAAWGGRELPHIALMLRRDAPAAPATPAMPLALAA